MKVLLTISIMLITVVFMIGSCVAIEDSKYTIENDIVYGKVNGREMKMNMVTLDDGKKNKPAMIVIHGGGWEAGTKEDGMWGAVDMANRGFTAFTIEYRLSGTDVWPAQIEDCKGAVRFVRANAKKFNIDPNKIGAIGYSAGGHLASMLGVLPAGKYEGKMGYKTTPSNVLASISYVGPENFEYYKTIKGEDIVRDQILHRLFGLDKEGNKDKKDLDYWLKDASPLTYVSKKSAPHLVLYGSIDQLVPYKQGYAFEEKMKKNGVYCKFQVFEGADHGLGPETSPFIQDFCDKFFFDKK